MFKFFKSKEKDIYLEDDKLIKMAEELLLGRYTRVSNGGGGFENVRIIKCTGVVNSMGYREVRFDVNDDWIGGVYYTESDIKRMYDRHLKTGKLPELM